MIGPAWAPSWCREHLGSEPVEVLFALDQMSTVVGLRLADGVDVVLKARPDDGRARACVTAQAELARRGLPCARPLTSVTTLGPLVVHAEELCPGGDVLHGDSAGVAVRYAEVFARLQSALDDVVVAPPLPNPRWVRWDHADDGLWPTVGFLDDRDQRLVPPFVVDTARRVRRRLLAAELPGVLGHADFEAQNVRWCDGVVLVVHDWDSLAWQPEAALVGAASGAFPRPPGQPPPLASIESSAAFLASYQDVRGREFTAREREVAWAASLWPAVHNARWEALLDSPTRVAGDAVRDQAAARLALARA